MLSCNWAFPGVKCLSLAWRTIMWYTETPPAYISQNIQALCSSSVNRILSGFSVATSPELFAQNSFSFSTVFLYKDDKWRILNLVLIQKALFSPSQTAASLSSSLSEPYPHFPTHSQQFQTWYHLLLILHSLNVSLKSKLVTEPCREHSVSTSSGLTVILKLFKAFHQLYGI